MCLISCIIIPDYTSNENNIPLIYFANVYFHFNKLIVPIDLINENCLGFDDILNRCLCWGKLSVTATNVSVW